MLVCHRRFEVVTVGGGVRISGDGAVIRGRTDPRLMILEIYAEGHVILEWGDDTLTADRLFLDLRRIEGKAEGVRLGLENLRKWIDVGDESDWGRGVGRNPRGGAPTVRKVFITTKELRILGPSRYEADRAAVTTCDYGVPHYALEASSVEVTERRRILVRGATARILGLPILYWPRLFWSMDWNPYVPSFQFGRSSEFGPFIESEWTLFTNRWLTLRGALDYYERRGTGYGIDARYRGGGALGALRTYGIHDRGDDELYLPPGETMERNRWRVRWFHRQRLPFDWEIYTEYSEQSDRNLLLEYFEREFRQSKDPESLLYLKKIRPYWGLTFLYQARRNDFDNVVESLPRATLEVVEAPVIPVPFLGRSVHYTQRTEVGNLRFRPDDVQGETGIDLNRNGIVDPPPIDLLPTPPGGYDLDGDGIPEYLPKVRSWRIDTYHQARLPVPLGPVTMAPFASGRYTYYERSLLFDDSTDRGQASAGVRFDTQIHRTFDANIPAVQANGLRHIFQPSLAYSIRYLNTKGPVGLIPFDAIDLLDEREAVTLNVRNRIQTRRPLLLRDGSVRPGAVDLFDLEIEGSYFPSRRPRPDRREFSDVGFDLRANLLPPIVLVGDADLDPVDGTVDGWSFGGFTMRPGLYTAGFSFRKVNPIFLIPGGENPRHFVTWGANVQLNEKWAVEAAGQYDLNQGRIVNQSYTVKRYLHEWVFRVSVDVDEGRGDTAVSFLINLRDLDRPRPIAFGRKQDFLGLPLGM